MLYVYYIILCYNMCYYVILYYNMIYYIPLVPAVAAAVGQINQLLVVALFNISSIMTYIIVIIIG